MAKNAFTALYVERAKPGADRREIPDPGLSGFYLVVQPSGVKSWAVRYRHEGRPRKMTIGPYPAFGLADARKAAGAALRAASEGRDPAAEKLEAKAVRPDEANLVSGVLDEFLQRYVRPNYRAQGAHETERLINREIKPKWKGRRVQTIGKRDVIALLDGITDRGAVFVANRTFALLRKFGNWAVERGVLETSPCAGMKPPAGEVSRDRLLTNDEIRLFWSATGETGWPFGPMARLLLLTGARRDEVAASTWGEMSRGADEPSWIIPADRSKNGRLHYVPLASAAVEILSALPRIAGDKGFIFTTTGTTPVSGFSRAKTNLDAHMLRLAQKAAQERGDDPAKVILPNWRLHDLRRTAASGMAALGQPVHVVEAVLNHRSGTISGIAAVYNRHDYADEKRRALAAWASFVTDLVSDKPAGNVVPMRAAQ